MPDFSAPKVVSRRAPQDMPPDALNEMLRIPADKLPTFVGRSRSRLPKASTGYLIAEVIASKEGEAITAGAARRASARDHSAGRRRR